MSGSDTVQVTGRSELTPEERGDALKLIGELLGIHGEEDPLIDMPMIAVLAGVAPGTPAAWQQRTKTGKERVPFPPPDDHRYHDKPQWRAVSTIIEAFLKPSRRWPSGSVARETTRGERPHTRRPTSGSTGAVGVAGLRYQDAALAEALTVRGLDDGRPRTVGGWRRRLNLATAKAAGTPSIEDKGAGSVAFLAG